jgi:hypothetical protein
VDDLIDAMNLEAEEEGGGTAWLVNPEENDTNFSVENESFHTNSLNCHSL